MIKSQCSHNCFIALLETIWAATSGRWGSPAAEQTLLVVHFPSTFSLFAEWEACLSAAAEEEVCQIRERYGYHEPSLIKPPGHQKKIKLLLRHLYKSLSLTSILDLLAGGRHCSANSLAFLWSIRSWNQCGPTCCTGICRLHTLKQEYAEFEPR